MQVVYRWYVELPVGCSQLIFMFLNILRLKCSVHTHTHTHTPHTHHSHTHTHTPHTHTHTYTHHTHTHIHTHTTHTHTHTHTSHTHTHTNIHTHTHTVGRNPLDEGSSRRRDLQLYNTRYSHETDIHAPAGIRTHNSSKRTAAYRRLRPGCHRNRHMLYLCIGADYILPIRLLSAGK